MNKETIKANQHGIAQGLNDAALANQPAQSAKPKWVMTDAQRQRAAEDPAYEAALMQAQKEANEVDQEKLDFARLIAREFPLGSNDWACKECHPKSDILIEGFVCVAHRAIKFASENAS